MRTFWTPVYFTIMSSITDPLKASWKIQGGLFSMDNRHIFFISTIYFGGNSIIASCDDVAFISIIVKNSCTQLDSSKHKLLTTFYGLHLINVGLPLRIPLSSNTSSCIKLAVWIISMISAKRRCCGVRSLDLNSRWMTKPFNTRTFCVNIGRMLSYLP